MQQLEAFLDLIRVHMSVLQKFLEPHAQTVFHYLHHIEPLLAGVLIVVGIVGRCMSPLALILAVGVITCYFCQR